MAVTAVASRPWSEHAGGQVKRVAAWGPRVADVLGAVAITVMSILHTGQSATGPVAAAMAFMAASFAVWIRPVPDVPLLAGGPAGPTIEPGEPGRRCS
jgi:hypothetical protein